MLKKFTIHISGLLICSLLLAVNTATFAQREANIDTSLVYPFEDEGEFQYPDEIERNKLFLDRPGNVNQKVVYDPDTRQYIIYEKVGDMYFRLPKTMTLEEYVKYDFDQSIKNYWKTRTQVEALETQTDRLIPQITIESEAFNNIFGSNVIDIRPQGYVKVEFGFESTYADNPNLPESVRRVNSFDFDEEISLSVSGKIGDRVDMKVNYNTEATFDYENKMNIDYASGEDDILRKIEAGNVSLPLNGTLIQGGTNLFGVKTEMQFGKLNLTTIISQHKGESQTVQTEGGAQKTTFEISASDYDENRHFFLSKYFRDNYDNALRLMPLVISNVKVNTMEVWVTNKSQNFTSARNIVGFVDLGESGKNIAGEGIITNSSMYQGVPQNEANSLYGQLIIDDRIREASTINRMMEATPLENGVHWDKMEQARKLSPTEYYINEDLGYISLRQPLNTDEILAVAYNLTVGDTTLQVGEFSADVKGDSTNNTQPTLILKLLKGTNLSPSLPTWDLMMKNVYSLGAYDLSPTDFDFNIVYKNDSTNTYVNYIPEEGFEDQRLLRMMNLDNLNAQKDPVENGDGMFDYVEGITVIKGMGRIVFPVVEPFGSSLATTLKNEALVEKYAYNTLYTDTKTKAEQDFEHDKFYFVGSYSGSSGSEIMLNAFNLAPGSVKVSAGGRQLTENEEYTVDYSLGRVKIIDEGLLESGTPIQVSTESQDMFSMQRKTMVGTYADYEFSDNFRIGGTMLYMNERPMTNKVDLGEEPISNLMLGLDMQYRTTSRFITDMLNLWPFMDSEAESSFAIESEVAKLFPGQSKATGNAVYIDDFEGVETPYPLNSHIPWRIASTPQGQEHLFPEASFSDSLAYGYNRAKLAWYFVDPIFNRVSSGIMPDHIKANTEERSNHYTRDVSVKEIYPGKEVPPGEPNTQYVLNLSFFPDEKGPYNFDAQPTNISAGVEQDGSLREPGTRWGGIMRDIQSSNFEASNIEFIEFWMLDPFIYDQGTHEGGELYFNLGDISEDILKDSRKSFENGLPKNEILVDVDTTSWGRVPTTQLFEQSFDNQGESRIYQDIGLDGMNSTDERDFFSNYIDNLRNILSPQALDKVIADPANDDFHYFRGDDYDANQVSIIDRYKRYNNLEGNSPVLNGSSSNQAEQAGQVGPDMEDINKDNTLNELESYYQYKVDIRPQAFQVGQNFIVDKITRRIELANGQIEDVDWYQFKVPVRQPTDTIGSISDFKSIRFMRMFMRDFSDSVTLRFATLDLIRSDWRLYEKPLSEDGAMTLMDTEFDVTSINIEENSNRRPINYVLPPGIEREIDPSNPQMIQQNEQSMLMQVKELGAGDAKAVYRRLGIDMRLYQNLKMDIHAEAIEGYPLEDEEVSFFIRLASDNNNYYEYEIPLKLTEVPTTLFDNLNELDRLAVWPNENRINFPLKVFTELKMNRDAEMRKAGSKLSRMDIFKEIHSDYINGKNILKIKGNPSLAEVNIIMLGVMNPKDKNTQPKSVEVWVNELRMADYEERGGWASNSRMSLRLADLGSITVAGRTQSVGWGSINQSVAQRSLENRTQVDVSASAELGKLLPEKLGIHAPVFYGYSRNTASPEYNPLSTDIKMKESLALIDDPFERDSVKAIAQDVVTRKSFNITNISIEPERKKQRKPMPYNIENFAVSYSQNEQISQNIDVLEDYKMMKKGSFNYNYSATGKSIEPFKKIGFLNNKALQLVRDFNFMLLPQMLSFRTDVTRTYMQRLARDNTGTGIEMPRTVQKDFLWNRYFDLRYNLARSLKVDFSNQNTSRIDEIEGYIYNQQDKTAIQSMRDTIINNLLALGRPVDYTHNLNVTYTLPINKLPLLKWTSGTLNYRGNYDWKAGPKFLPSKEENDSIDYNIGNVIRNGMNATATARFNVLTLYNGIPYLKKVNDKYKTTRQQYGQRARRAQSAAAQKKESDEPARTKEVKFTDKSVSFKAEVPKSIFHELRTEEVEVFVVSAKGDTIQGEMEIVNENRLNFTTVENLNEAKVLIIGQREVGESFAKKALDIAVRMAMGVQNVQASYQLNGGTELPGFLPEPYIFGGNRYTSGSPGTTSSAIAPTIPFLMGWQDRDFGIMAGEKGWVSKSSLLNQPYLFNSAENYSITATVEPIPNLRINLTANHRQSDNNTSYIRPIDGDNGAFEMQNLKQFGNYSMSVFTLKTAFKDQLKSDGTSVSPSFDNFRAYRSKIVNRLNEERGYNAASGTYVNRPGDALANVNGVSESSTEVLIPAFLAAYTGNDPLSQTLNVLPSVGWMRPNWRVSYNGNPQTIDWMKNYVQSLNFNHNYNASFSVANFETDDRYSPEENGHSWTRNTLDNAFYPKYMIETVSLNEAFNPLINMDIGFVNDLSTRFELSRSRMLILSFANNQLTETIKKGFTLGLGYRFTGLDMIVKTRKSSSELSNDINLRLDITSSNSRTRMMSIDTGKESGTKSGSKILDMNFTADYMLSDRFTLQLFYLYNMNKPYNTDSYQRRYTNFGLSFNFTIM